MAPQGSYSVHADHATLLRNTTQCIITNNSIKIFRRKSVKKKKIDIVGVVIVRGEIIFMYLQLSNKRTITQPLVPLPAADIRNLPGRGKPEPGRSISNGSSRQWARTAGGAMGASSGESQEEQKNTRSIGQEGMGGPDNNKMGRDLNVCSLVL